MWTIDQVEINGGFLPNFKLTVPSGLICIIGPRGSGKSTLAEALRFAIKGSVGASKKRLDLLQANIGTGGVVTLAVKTDSGVVHTIKRAHKQAALVLSEDGRVLSNVDLDRGTYLRLDAYNHDEIESIADEVLGEKRRALLDDLRGEEFSSIRFTLGERRRALQANADHIRATRRAIDDLCERIEEFGDVRAKLDAMQPLPESGPTTEYAKASKQRLHNERERKRVDEITETLKSIGRAAETLKARASDENIFQVAEQASANHFLMEERQAELQQSLKDVSQRIDSVTVAIDSAVSLTEVIAADLAAVHSNQLAEFTGLQQIHNAADERSRDRLELEQRVSRLEQTERERAAKQLELGRLLENRKSLKGDFLLEREQISRLRDSISKDLQAEIGDKVRIRVLPNADNLAYRSLLTQGLRGAGVRNHDEILDSLLQLRPEQLAQFLQSGDHAGLDEACALGPERAKKILSSFRDNIDSLELEVVEIEDQVRIELNVGTTVEPLFRDAADLSQGQKCTALLPLLLARTTNPLIIDQPEDNLDNHFIYETVVNAITRLKPRRQMFFITHNANIPVLADADLIIVMNSRDGKTGFIEKSGSVDQCRDQIVDLLEGGKQAFELRRKRYARD
jgi:ABC-type cobalamin/Fe3+-siderophores transport system ATPase subunit